MKIKITPQELNECFANAVKRVMNEKKGDYKFGFEKATKSANRDLERETYGDGFKSYDKVHKTKKDYNRKGKGKFDYRNYIDENFNEEQSETVSPFDNDYDE